MFRLRLMLVNVVSDDKGITRGNIMESVLLYCHIFSPWRSFCSAQSKLQLKTVIYLSRNGPFVCGWIVRKSSCQHTEITLQQRNNPLMKTLDSVFSVQIQQEKTIETDKAGFRSFK